MAAQLQVITLIKNVGRMFIRRPLLSLGMVIMGSVLYAIPRFLFIYFVAHKPGFRLASEAFKSMAHEAIMGQSINIHEVMPIALIDYAIVLTIFAIAGIIIATGVYYMVCSAGLLMAGHDIRALRLADNWHRLLAFIPLYLLLSFAWDDVFSLPVSYLDTELGHWLLVRNMRSLFLLGLLGIPLALLGIYLYFRFYTYQSFFILERASYSEALDKSWHLTSYSVKPLVLSVIALRCIIGLSVSLLSCVLLPLVYCLSLNPDTVRGFLYVFELGLYCWVSTLCAVAVYYALETSFREEVVLS